MRAERLSLQAGIEWTLRPTRNVLRDRIAVSGWKTICVLSPEPYTPGDHIACVLEIPLRENSAQKVCVECAVTVERVEVNATDPGFSVSCRVHQCSVFCEEALTAN